MEYDPNKVIKEEPSSDNQSSLSTASNDFLDHNVIANIKTEPGEIIPKHRLPSLFAKRDLTFGGNKLEKPKKVFTPNINAQRLKLKEDPNAGIKNNNASKREKGHGQERRKNERERGKDGGRGRGRGKLANNLVQSSGIFSEGLADVPGSRRSGSSYSGYRERDGSGSDRESLNKLRTSAFKKIDRSEDDEKSKRLLMDSLNTDEMDVDEDESSAPLTLPMFSKAKVSVLKNRKLEPKSDNDIEQLAKLPNGKVDEPTTEIDSVALPKLEDEKKETLTVTEVLEKNSKPNNFILLQLPDCLPGLRESDDNPGDKKAKPITEPIKENSHEKINSFCTLNDLKEGMLGKLQILKSGKVRMILGDNNLLVDLGSTVSFRQDLIAAKINDDEHDLVNLGRVNSTLICAPDWEDLLKIL